MIVSLLGEHALSEHIDSDDLPAALKLKVNSLQEGENSPASEFGLVITGAQGQEELLNECDGIASSHSLHDDRLGAQDWEADDLWLEEQNAAMADVQFWWVEGDEADLLWRSVEVLVRSFMWGRPGFQPVPTSRSTNFNGL